MATFTQLPGTLDVTLVQGDEIAIALDFDRDLSGYTLSVPIYITAVFASGGGGSGFVETVGATVTNFAVSAPDLEAGQLLIGLSENQTSQLSPGVGYRWYMRWIDPGAVTRTVLSGTLTVVNP